ncbi:hypothetical protein [Paenarthrobacter histidinolovorans]|uniref:hypothetical protein n=1 Tax=Paenarthrobacter histidinolovorans TaxID=43664 RepID=UPI00166BBE83|nr:hypothetical protein [Paenarthrobacter histidinolovorans]
MTHARDLALPHGYTDLLGDLKSRGQAARPRAVAIVITGSNAAGVIARLEWADRDAHLNGKG